VRIGVQWPQDWIVSHCNGNLSSQWKTADSVCCQPFLLVVE
jgi:hypothetical protein